jgi:Trypsin-co-occurring domain 2
MVTVGREAKPGAKIRFWVIEAGGDAKISREAVQEINLVLTPWT